MPTAKKLIATLLENHNRNFNQSLTRINIKKQLLKNQEVSAKKFENRARKNKYMSWLF